ncbi:hypothetical protein ABZ468_48850 [Streptomyces sp. NPDC005708]|uniref:hypothetical protein n=1 Tax=Streptomyces sp. NPDC005708 TaxID=3154564 RepID=UPI0033E709A0
MNTPILTPATRVGIARTSVGIALLALQTVEDIVNGPLTPQELAEILREFHCEADPQAGVFGQVAQLLTAAGDVAERLAPDGDGEASCPLHEAAGFITDSAGERIYQATRALDPQGERTR